MQTLTSSLAMEDNQDIVMEEILPTIDAGADQFSHLLNSIRNSSVESHFHVISQQLKDNNIPLTLPSYFIAISSSLRLLAVDPDPPIHIVDKLLTLLSSVLRLLPHIPQTVKTDYLPDLLVKFVVSNSSAASGLECMSIIMRKGDRNSMYFSNNIMNCFKSYLKMNEPIVTRRIADALYYLCLQPNVEVSPELLLDLLLSFAKTVSVNETGDNMAFTARLLDVGMRKLFNLNPQICVSNLPVIFRVFGEILAFNHAEPLHVAMEGYKSLISTCIDENLIEQCVVQKTNSSTAPTRELSLIGEVCKIFESLLDYRYVAVWDISFQVVAAMFSKLGEDSPYFLKSTLCRLANMEKLQDKDFPYRKQLHECVGYALVAMGPKAFLEILPLEDETKNLCEANMWLFPILKQYTIGAQLSYFTKSLLPMIERVREKSALLKKDGRIESARSIAGVVYSLWSLLPSFCNYPQDTAESFDNLKEILCKSLREEPDIRGLICSSLQILAQQNKDVLEEKDAFSGKEGRYTREAATRNLNALRSSAPQILFDLSKIFSESLKDDGGSLQNTISLFASIADKDEVSTLFYETMDQVDNASDESSETSSSMEVDDASGESSSLQQRARLYDLAVSYLPGLNTEDTDALYDVIKCALKDVEGLIQKKAYKVLSILLKNSDGFISRNLQDLASMMEELQFSCHLSAKRHRLNCLYYLIVHVYEDESEQRKFLAEILLSLKEVNKKSRNRAYDILVQIGHALEDKGGSNEKLHLFFNRVGAAGQDSPHPCMISASVKGLARLAYEFTDLVSTAYNFLPRTFSDIQNVEVIKANLGLLKVLVVKSQAEDLRTYLRSMVEVLLSLPDSTRHFKAKVKLLLEMLSKKCGFDAVKSVMPDEHMRLLTNIQKIAERKEKKLAANTEETRSHQSKAATSRLSRLNHKRKLSDYDVEETDSGNGDYIYKRTISSRYMKPSSMRKTISLRSKRMRKKERWLSYDIFDQSEDEPLNLLDQQKIWLALRSSENHLNNKQQDTYDEPEIDSMGRLIIHEDGNKSKREIIPMEPNFTEVRSQAGNRLKRRRISESSSQYSSKKAGGDLKRKKDKLEPYAYWPLDRKLVSRRPDQQAAARKGMASVVKLTKRLEGNSVSNALSMKSSKLKGKNKSGQKKRRL